MSPVEPTEERPAPAPAASPRRGGSPDPRGWATLALATACGFLLGVLVVAATGGTDARTTTTTRRVTVTAPPRTTGGTVIVRTLVPAMVGEPLDVAKERAARSRFSLEVDAGGGLLLGLLPDSRWEVIAQRPAAGELLEQGSTLHVDVKR